MNKLLKINIAHSQTRYVVKYLDFSVTKKALHQDYYMESMRDLFSINNANNVHLQIVSK